MHAKAAWDNAWATVFNAPPRTVLSTVAIGLVAICLVALLVGGTMASIVSAAISVAAVLLVFAPIWLFYWVRQPLQAKLAARDAEIDGLKKTLGVIATRDAQIESLTARLAVMEEKRPKLTLHFRDNDPDFFSIGWYFVYVSNDSKTSTSHQSVVQIADLKKIGRNGDEVPSPIGVNNRPFPWTTVQVGVDLVPLPEVPNQFPQNPRFDLHAGEKRPIPIVSYDAEKSAIRLCWFGWVNGFYLPRGSYRIHLEAHGQNARSDDIHLVVGLNDSDKLICEFDKSRPPVSRQAAHGTGDGHSPDSEPDQRTAQDHPTES